MAASSSALPCSLLIAAVMLLSPVIQAQGVTRNYDFNVRPLLLAHIVFEAATTKCRMRPCMNDPSWFLTRYGVIS
jgi:hypothetical protein